MPASMVVYTPTFPKESGGVPVCNAHYARVEKDDITWDGVWYKFLPLCKLDRKLMFDENEGVPHADTTPVPAPDEEKPQEGKTLVEVFAEEDITEEERDLVSGLLQRLAAGELDAD